MHHRIRVTIKHIFSVGVCLKKRIALYVGIFLLNVAWAGTSPTPDTSMVDPDLILPQGIQGIILECLDKQERDKICVEGTIFEDADDPANTLVKNDDGEVVTYIPAESDLQNTFLALYSRGDHSGKLDPDSIGESVLERMKRLVPKESFTQTLKDINSLLRLYQTAKQFMTSSGEISDPEIRQAYRKALCLRTMNRYRPHQSYGSP